MDRSKGYESKKRANPRAKSLRESLALEIQAVEDCSWKEALRLADLQIKTWNTRSR